MAPPGAVTPTLQLCESVKSVLPTAGVQLKGPAAVLVTGMVVEPLSAAELVTVTVIVSPVVLRAS